MHFHIRHAQNRSTSQTLECFTLGRESPEVYERLMRRDGERHAVADGLAESFAKMMERLAYDSDKVENYCQLDQFVLRRKSRKLLNVVTRVGSVPGDIAACVHCTASGTVNMDYGHEDEKISSESYGDLGVNGFAITWLPLSECTACALF